MAAPREVNARLSAVIAEAGCTYEALARAVQRVAQENGDTGLRANKSAVAHWVAGTQPQPRTAAFLAEALARRLGRGVTLADIGLAQDAEGTPLGDTLPSDPVDAVARLGRADVDRRAVLRGAVYSVSALALPLSHRAELTDRVTRARAGGVIGRAEADAVAEVTAVFNRADERLGGEHGRSAVVEYLCTDVVTYCSATFATEADRRAMFAAAAQLAYLAGWKAHDAGRNGLAQRYYLHAYQLADEADPYAHAGYIFRILAHQALDIGRREHCVDLADEALARVRGRVDAETESLFWLTRARACAASDDARGARRALQTAEQLVSRAPVDERPAYVSLGGPGEARLSSQTAKALASLGDLPAAESQFRRSAACWNPTSHPRIRALTLANLAEVQCERGNVEQACATWESALDGMAGVRSARTREAVGRMRQHLATLRGRGVRAATRLDARAAKSAAV